MNVRGKKKGDGTKEKMTIDLQEKIGNDGISQSREILKKYDPDVIRYAFRKLVVKRRVYLSRAQKKTYEELVKLGAVEFANKWKIMKTKERE